MPGLSHAQQRMANLIYTIAYDAMLKAGIGRGMATQRALEMVSAAYAESGLNPQAHNPSGASGLFQLLSPGYVTSANSMGGVYNPIANIKAILPSYIAYWKAHPSASVGEGGRDVERSGAGASFYSAAYAWIGSSITNLAGNPQLLAQVERAAAAGAYTGPGGAPAFGVNQTSAGELSGLLRGFGLNPGLFQGLIDQAIRGNWSDAEFEGAVYNTQVFHDTFPGIFRPDGSLKMSPLEYRQTADQFKKIANDYGIKADTTRIGWLFQYDKSPDEFQNMAEIAKATILSDNMGLRKKFNQELHAVGEPGLDMPGWFKTLAKQSSGRVYDLYEAAVLRDAGLNLGGAKGGYQTAKQIGKEGEFVDLQSLVAQIRSVQDLVKPELRQAGVSDSDLAIMEGGKDLKNQADLLQQILRNRRALSGSLTRPAQAGEPGRPTLFPGVSGGV